MFYRIVIEKSRPEHGQNEHVYMLPFQVSSYSGFRDIKKIISRQTSTLALSENAFAFRLIIVGRRDEIIIEINWSLGVVVDKLLL